MCRIGITLGGTRPNRNGEQVALSMITEFANLSSKPGDYHVGGPHTPLDQVIAWSTAPAPHRQTPIAT